MIAKLIIDGREFEVEISEESAKKLEERPKKTGYERVKYDQVFYYDACDGESGSDYDQEGDGAIDKMYDAANYYSDETVAKNNVRADKLMRQLRRFAVEHRKAEIDCLNDCWCEIYYDYRAERLIVEDMSVCKFFGVICFDSATVAQLAIDTFRDELIWYFTEYKDSL